MVYLREARQEALHSLQALVGEVVDGSESVGLQPVVAVVVVEVPAPELATGLVELVKLIKLQEEVWSMGLSRKIRWSS